MPQDYNRAHEFLNGLQFNEGGWIGGVDFDPDTGSGLAAPLGSLVFQTDGEIWRKVGPADTDWQLRSLGDPTATQTVEQGKTGNLSNGAFLNRSGNVPSNIVGSPILLSQPKIETIEAGNENTVTGDLLIYESDINFGSPTLLYTLSFVSTQVATASGLSILATRGKFIAIQASGTSFKNCGISIGLKGLTI